MLRTRASRGQRYVNRAKRHRKLITGLCVAYLRTRHVNADDDAFIILLVVPLAPFSHPLSSLFPPIAGVSCKTRDPASSDSTLMNLLELYRKRAYSKQLSSSKLLILQNHCDNLIRHIRVTYRKSQSRHARSTDSSVHPIRIIFPFSAYVPTTQTSSSSSSSSTTSSCAQRRRQPNFLSFAIPTVLLLPSFPWTEKSHFNISRLTPYRSWPGARR